jgi:hypothetical protein
VLRALVVPVAPALQSRRERVDTQVLQCVVDAGRVRSVDQFVGDPAAVTAFWAEGG